MPRRTVIYPPVDTRAACLAPEHDDFCLSVGRLVAAKRIAACNSLARTLRIVSTGGKKQRFLSWLAGRWNSMDASVNSS